MEERVLETNAAIFRQEMKRAAKRRLTFEQDDAFEESVESWLVITFTDKALNFLVTYVSRRPALYPITVQKNLTLPLPKSKRLLQPREVSVILRDGIRTLFGDQYDVCTLMQQGLGLRVPVIKGVLICLPPEWGHVAEVGSVFSVAGSGRRGRKLTKGFLETLRAQMLMENEMAGWVSIDAFATGYILDGKSIGCTDPEGSRCHQLELKASLVFGDESMMEAIQGVLLERFKREQIRWHTALCGFSTGVLSAEQVHCGYVVLDISESSVTVNFMREQVSLASRLYALGTEMYSRYTTGLLGEDQTEEAGSHFCAEYFESVFDEIKLVCRELGLSGVPLLVLGDHPTMVAQVVEAASCESLRAEAWSFRVKGEHPALVARALCAIQDLVRFDAYSRFSCISYRTYRMNHLLQRSGAGIVAFSKVVLVMIMASITVFVRRRHWGE